MPALPTADRYLTEFFDDRRRGASGTRRERIDRTECDLRLTIETAADAVLEPADLVLLGAEREFDRLGAAARVLPVPGLAAALERFVTDPVYRPLDAVEAVERLETSAALLRRLARDPALQSRTRLLRRVDEAIRMQAVALSPRRRRSTRRVRG